MNIITLDDYHAPSLNQWQRMHYMAREREIIRVMDYLVAYGIRDMPQFDGKVRVRYVRCRKAGPPMDDDNIAASFKPIGDALERLNVVKNDRDITLEPHQVLDGTKRTVLEIEQLSEVAT